jgi:surface antigen
VSFNKTVAALAIIFAGSIIGAHPTFADTKQSTPASATPAASDTKKVEPVMVTVNAGDSLSSIADTHNTTWVRIFNANDTIANPDVIDVGQTLRIPEGDEQLPDRYGALAPVSTQVVTTAAPAQSTQQADTPTVVTQSVNTASVGNRYAWGNCTWYVYNRKPHIGSFWGNASQWLGSAQASGYATGPTPVAGAIGVQPGHVVYVESVSGNMVSISEMNYAGGVGVVHYRTVPASTFYYIYA